MCKDADANVAQRTIVRRIKFSRFKTEIHVRNFYLESRSFVNGKTQQWTEKKHAKQKKSNRFKYISNGMNAFSGSIGSG